MSEIRKVEGQYNNLILTRKQNMRVNNDLPMFEPPKNDKNKGTSVEYGDTDEFKFALKLKELLNNTELLNDEIIIQTIEEYKKLNLADIYNEFRINNDGKDLMTVIQENSKLKKSTKDKLEKYFAKELSNCYSFDKNFKKENDKTVFKFGNYKYESDEYNVIQKDENVIEIKNLLTGEVRVVDLQKIIPEKYNGMDKFIALKAAVQNLPADILFQIPQEVSIILDADIVHTNTKLSKIKPNISDNGTFVAFNNGTDVEVLTSLPDREILVHEIAHSVLFDENGNDVLERDKNFQKIFNEAKERFNKENKNLTADEINSKHYWSTDISELGAEIICSAYIKDYEGFESIKKYAPEAIPIVLEIYKNRLTSDDRHFPFDIKQFDVFFAE